MDKSPVIADTLISAYKRINGARETALARFDMDMTAFKLQLMHAFGLEVGDEVTLHIHDYREDSCGCFIVAREVKCYVTAICIYESEYQPTFLAPTVVMKDKRGKLKKKNYNYNQFCSWTLVKDGKVLIDHPRESEIIECKYTQEQIDKIRHIYQTEQGQG